MRNNATKPTKKDERTPQQRYPKVAADLFRPGDTARKAPAIPIPKREEFLADVKVERDGTLTRQALAKKWRRFIEWDRTLYTWIVWAREVLLARQAQEKA